MGRMSSHVVGHAYAQKIIKDCHFYELPDIDY